MPVLGPGFGRWYLRVREAVYGAGLRFFEFVFPRLPAGAVLAFADVLGLIGWLLDRRGREVGRQNLEAVFGETKSRRERARILRASYRNAVRVEALLFHLQPLTRARFERWVRVDHDHLEEIRRLAGEGWRGVIVAGHHGNWELLFSARSALTDAPPFAYLVEGLGSRVMDETFERLRNGGGGVSLRKSGALALRRALAEGKCVSFLMDRNVRGQHGGDYVPFLGLPARTSPLGAVLARAYGVPLIVGLMTPDGPRRWHFRLSEDLMPPASADPAADIASAVLRANDILSAAILKHPEAWLWRLKRFKSRPTAEQGRHPAYSFHDPDR